jgi:hypothetical protein
MLLLVMQSIAVMTAGNRLQDDNFLLLPLRLDTINVLIRIGFKILCHLKKIPFPRTGKGKYSHEKQKCSY